MDKSPHASLLRWSTAFLVLSGYLSLAAVAQIGPVILLIPILALSFSRMGERLDASSPGYGVISRAITVAYFCFLPLMGIKLGLLPTVVILVIYIQCYTLLHVKTARNYYHLFLMSLFLLLAACVQSPEPIVGVIMLLFLISAVWANMTLRIVLEECAQEHASDVELVALDSMHYHAYREQPTARGSSVPGLAAILSLFSVTLTAMCFFVTPRIEAGVLGRNQNESQTVGLSDSVDLQAGGLINEDQTPVMLVQFPEEPNGQLENPDWLYWRVTTLNTYNNDRWSSQEIRLLEPGIRNLSSGQRGRDGDIHRVERTMRPNSRTVYQTIYMDDVPRMGLPALDLVQRVRADEKARGMELGWGGDADLTVRMYKSTVRHLNYEVWSEVGDPPPDELRKIPADFSGISAQDLELLTASPLGEQTRELTASLISEKTNLYDRVEAVEAYLSGPDFIYSLEIPEFTSGSVLDQFINVTRKGHCELFASAMALMLRSQGIPARVVSGYRGGEWNDSDLTYTIRANMAHLWVEVWFPEVGWVLFDPSPRAEDLVQSGLGKLTMLASRALLKTKIFWFREVVGFDRATQAERLQNFSLGLIQSFRTDVNSPSSTQSGVSGLFGLVVPLLVLLVLLAGIALVMLRVRWIPVPRASLLNEDQIRVARLYLMLRRRLQQFGVSSTGMTAEEIHAELQRERWGSPAEALEVLALYNAVRFGYQSPNVAELPALRKAILALRPRRD